MKSISSFLILSVLTFGCGTGDPRSPVVGWLDKKVAESDAKAVHDLDTFSIGPVRGKGWKLDARNATGVEIYDNGELTFAYQLNALTFPLTNSFNLWEEYKAYLATRQEARINKSKILEESYQPTHRFGKMEAQCYIKARVTKFGTNYLMQLYGYEFIHPLRPAINVALVYAEVHCKDQTNATKLKQAEDFFATFRAK
jgi:hypothetical protein